MLLVRLRKLKVAKDVHKEDLQAGSLRDLCFVFELVSVKDNPDCVQLTFPKGAKRNGIVAMPGNSP